MKVLERLAKDAYEDKYFKELYDKANELLFNVLFQEQNIHPLSQKELIHILRFCDILSNSEEAKYRNLSYKIITLLHPFYEGDSFYKTVSTAVLNKLGNFPALELLEYQAQLPLDREMEREIKKVFHKIDNFEGMFLTDHQFRLYKKLQNSNSFSFSGPTSMGKSFMMKITIADLMKKDNKPNIAIIVPTRALIHQFAAEIKSELYGLIEEHGFTIITSGNLEGIEIGDSKLIMILTPERLLAYLSDDSYPVIDTLFIDEAHKLAQGQDKRSVTLYTAIERAIYVNRDIQILFASPNVTNPEVFLQLFNRNTEQIFYSNESPVAQQLFYIDIFEGKVVHYTDYESKTYRPEILDEKDGLSIINSLSKDKSNLIYCNSIRHTVEKAIQFSERFGVKVTSQKENEKITEAIETIKKTVHPDYFLIDCLKRGVGYHFGNLPQVIRHNIEALFKEGVIKYLFCTSTLLEGVNLPAKNVFILQNKNGKRKFEKVDFWNLAGRAGRLKYELSGNIFCIREEKNSWKKIDDLIKNKEQILLKPTVSSNIETKIKQIEAAIENKNIEKSTVSEREIIHYLANIISIDTIELPTGYKTPIIQKLLDRNEKEILELAQNRVKNITVPKNILKSNQLIDVIQQESAYQDILENKNVPKSILFPNAVNYENCLAVLENFYTIYQWGEYESKLKNKEALRYFALLMNKWINGTSLNELISDRISYFSTNRKNIFEYKNNERQAVRFIKGNKWHVNTLINDLIREIEEILRFHIQKYVNHYYLMLQEVLGKNNAGTNWGNFIEYGTRSSAGITLQNLGLSRHVADYLIRNYPQYFKFKDGRLINIRKNRLLEELDENSIERQEVLLFL
ncbi:DEAD/DEAH box helicase [Niallia sp.]|uniref:DEAD/DEAH box helicase n=1 Tax=Niallia sp. TaxID=2837523 RepID=UPI0028A02C67|nr:DEAD/DEAH box helicase [Niallia sp.]